MASRSDKASEESPAELLGAVRAGETGAWRRLVERMGPRVMAVAQEEGLSTADAEEVFQATWIALFRQLPALRSPNALPAWIVTTTRRQAWRLRHRRKPESLSEDNADLGADPNMDPAAVAQSHETRELVHSALAELSERCRELLDRYYLQPEAENAEELALSLGMPRGSVGPTRLRCLEKLLRVLERRRIPEIFRTLPDTRDT